jgi:succinate dehydrogenase / fumarate reductase, cytochrome b subunit
MSSQASTLSRVGRLWAAPIGKKAVMALTGVVLYGFAFGHMAGNLQFFLGPTRFDAYGAGIKANAALLWGVRSLLLVSIVFHVITAVQLTALKRQARPQAYKKPGRVAGSYASKSMFYGGLVLLAFLIFHILHFTTGNAHPNFVEGAAYANVVNGFRIAPVAVFYIFAMLALSMHLYHGVWSVFQSLGFNHPRYTPKLKTFAKVFSAVVTAGFISLPIAVLAGIAA